MEVREKEEEERDKGEARIVLGEEMKKPEKEGSGR